MEQDSITVYSLSTCSACKAVKKLLEENDVGFQAIDVDLLETDEKADVMKTFQKLHPLTAFPTSVIGGKVIVGFKEKEILKALNVKPATKTHSIKKIVSKLFET